MTDPSQLSGVALAEAVASEVMGRPGCPQHYRPDTNIGQAMELLESMYSFEQGGRCLIELFLTPDIAPGCDVKFWTKNSSLDAEPIYKTQTNFAGIPTAICRAVLMAARAKETT